MEPSELVVKFIIYSRGSEHQHTLHIFMTCVHYVSSIHWTSLLWHLIVCRLHRNEGTCASSLYAVNSFFLSFTGCNCIINLACMLFMIVNVQDKLLFLLAVARQRGWDAECRISWPGPCFCLDTLYSCALRRCSTCMKVLCDATTCSECT